MKYSDINKDHRGVRYYSDRFTANLVLKGLPQQWDETARIVEYGRGYAVQLHKSGPYFGGETNPDTHKCDWCPAC